MDPISRCSEYLPNGLIGPGMKQLGANAIKVRNFVFGTNADRYLTRPIGENEKTETKFTLLRELRTTAAGYAKKVISITHILIFGQTVKTDGSPLTKLGFVPLGIGQYLRSDDLSAFPVKLNDYQMVTPIHPLSGILQTYLGHRFLLRTPSEADCFIDHISTINPAEGKRLEEQRIFLENHKKYLVQNLKIPEKVVNGFSLLSTSFRNPRAFGVGGVSREQEARFIRGVFVSSIQKLLDSLEDQGFLESAPFKAILSSDRASTLGVSDKTIRQAFEFVSQSDIAAASFVNSCWSHWFPEGLHLVQMADTHPNCLLEYKTWLEGLLLACTHFFPGEMTLIDSEGTEYLQAEVSAKDSNWSKVSYMCNAIPGTAALLENANVLHVLIAASKIFDGSKKNSFIDKTLVQTDNVDRLCRLSLPSKVQEMLTEYQIELSKVGKFILRLRCDTPEPVSRVKVELRVLHHEVRL